MPKVVPLDPMAAGSFQVDFDELDLGELLPKFNIQGSSQADEGAAPRKPSNIDIVAGAAGASAESVDK